MNTSKLTYLFIIITTVIVVLGTIGLYLIGLQDQRLTINKKPQTESTKQIISVIPSVKQGITPKLPKETLTSSQKDALIKKLPHIGNGFVVEYFSTAGRFYVTVESSDIQGAEYTAAVNWLKSQGIENPAQTSDIQFTLQILRK